MTTPSAPRRRCQAPRCASPLPAAARAGTLYCSPACRQRAWRARERQKEIDDRVYQECDRCGKRLRLVVRRNGVRRLVRRDVKYCSQRCQKQHARHRPRFDRQQRQLPRFRGSRGA